MLTKTQRRISRDVRMHPARTKDLFGVLLFFVFIRRMKSRKEGRRLFIQSFHNRRTMRTNPHALEPVPHFVIRFTDRHLVVLRVGATQFEVMTKQLVGIRNRIVTFLEFRNSGRA